MTYPLVVRWRFYLIGVLVTCITGGCGSVSEPVEPVVANRVEIQTGGLSNPFGVLVGVTVDLTARVLDRNGKLVAPQPQITFTSSQPGKVAVTTGGRVTGVDLGEGWVIARVTGSIPATPDSVLVFVVRQL